MTVSGHGSHDEPYIYCRFCHSVRCFFAFGGRHFLVVNAVVFTSHNYGLFLGLDVFNVYKRYAVQICALSIAKQKIRQNRRHTHTQTHMYTFNHKALSLVYQTLIVFAVYGSHCFSHSPHDFAISQLPLLYCRFDYFLLLRFPSDRAKSCTIFPHLRLNCLLAEDILLEMLVCVCVRNGASAFFFVR